MYTGIMAEYDLNHNFAVIEVYAFFDVHVGPRHVLEIPSHGDVLLVALGRGVIGQLITRTAMLSGDLRVSEDEDEDRASKISEVHLYDDMRILLCFYYYMHGSNKLFFILFVTRVPYHFIQM